MAISAGTDSGRTDSRTPFDSLPPGSLSRYDLALLVIPLAFACGVAVGSTLAVPRPASLVGASLFAAVVVTDTLFLNPPTVR